LSEYAVETHKRKGDKKRIDFLLVNKKNKRQALAIELKWFVAASKTVKIDGDLSKLSITFLQRTCKSTKVLAIGRSPLSGAKGKGSEKTVA